MKIHECLFFIDWCHSSMERAVSNKGPWCWPTRELLVMNLRENSHVFGGSTVRADFNTQLRIAKRRGWVIEEPCQPHCHADHIRLTGIGQETLRLMNDNGCDRLCAAAENPRPCVRAGFHLRRKVARKAA
jgi:hypothetical protein